MQVPHASPPQQPDEAPLPDPRCEDLDLDEDPEDYLAPEHPCAECWERSCVCDPETM